MIQKELIRKTPVILDTDIGSDIDDTWAVAMMLNSPELDVRMILTEHGNTGYRAKIVAKLLEAANRTDIPIGVGLKSSDTVEAQGPWVENYELDKYPGTVYTDGVKALIDTIMDSEEQLTLISIGPVTNIARALELCPDIAKKVRFVGMQGSLRKGYEGASEIIAECNVWLDPKSCQKVFSAPWDITITPVDTCGLVKLTGEKYLKVFNCQNPLVRALIENYRIWNKYLDTSNKESSMLFDTVAIYLAFSEELLQMEELNIEVTDDGYTLINETGKKMKCATGWKDMEAFHDLLVQRLIG
jgi:Inosine-uridine nucleoside N-ribohydrolase